MNGLFQLFGDQMAFGIAHPRVDGTDAAPIQVPFRFAAAGVTDVTKGDVVGFLTNAGTDTIIAYGKTVRCRPRRLRRWQWMIVFDASHVPVSTKVDLHVKNLKNDAALRRRFLQLPRVAYVANYGFTVDWPTDNSEHCSSGFIAYGSRDLTEAPLAAEVFSTQGTPADSIYEDTDTGFWCAVFPELANDIYDLEVTGVETGSAFRTGLDIRANLCT